MRDARQMLRRHSFISSPRSLCLRYGLSLLSTGLATSLWLLADEQLVPSPFLLYAAAVALSAWWAGLGPALLAMGTGAAASLLLYYLPLDPSGFSATQAATHVIIFVLVSLLITALQVARQRAQDALAHQALHDPLTGLPNRRLFADRLEQLLASAQRTGRSFVLVLLDLDGFKAVNDTFGHLQGDVVLIQVASRLRTHLRASDTIARFGGDEFVLLFPETDEVRARAMLRTVEHLLVEPFVLNGHRVAVPASIGLAVFPDHGMTEEGLLEQADRTMYASKPRQAAGGAVDGRAPLKLSAGAALAGAAADGQPGT